MTDHAVSEAYWKRLAGLHVPPPTILFDAAGNIRDVAFVVATSTVVSDVCPTGLCPAEEEASLPPRKTCLPHTRLCTSLMETILSTLAGGF